MNNRLTLQDLATLMAEVSGKDRAAAELFLREFVTIVSERVCENKIVKVKGLGTFKVIPVEERESVHVNTGERFIIPAHYKFSFLPDRELREQVNKPFSFFETTEINENVVFPDMEIAEDTEKKENDDESIEEVTPDKTVMVPLQEIVETDKEEVVENKEEKEKTREETNPSFKQEELTSQPQSEPAPEPVVETLETAGKNFPVKRTNRLKWMIGGGVFVFLLIAVNVGLYMNKTFFLKPALVDTEPAESRPELLPADSATTVTLVSTPDTVSVSVTDSVAVTEEPVPTTQEVPDILAKVKIEAGSRLTLISLEYYGSKLFWVYIYEHNKSIIKDPNNVPIGTVLEIPAPGLYGIDAHDRSSLEKAAARQTEILSGKM